MAVMRHNLVLVAAMKEGGAVVAVVIAIGVAGDGADRKCQEMSPSISRLHSTRLHHRHVCIFL